jgi:hypothetical protein
MLLQAVAALLASCAGVDGPELLSASPASAAAGDTVTLHGTGFCPHASEGECGVASGDVVFGLETPIGAAITRWTATEIDVVVPTLAPVGATEIILTTDGRSSGALAFEVLAP